MEATTVEVPCLVEGITWEEREHFSGKPDFGRWRRNSLLQEPGSAFVDVYTASVVLTVDFGKGVAGYTEFKALDGIDCCMRKGCYPEIDLSTEANAGAIRNFPTGYDVSSAPTVRQFGKIVGRFWHGHECVGIPEFFHRLTAGDVHWEDLQNEEWLRWREAMVELKIVTGLEVLVGQKFQKGI